MGIIEAREQEARDEVAKREQEARDRVNMVIRITDAQGPNLYWDGQESQAEKLAQFSFAARSWVAQARKTRVRSEVEQAVAAAVAAATSVAELHENTDKRKADTQARVDASMAMLRAARLRYGEAESAVDHGTPDASEAVRNYLEYVAACAERNYLQYEHDRLLKQASLGAMVQVSEWSRSVAYAVEVAQTLRELNDTYGTAEPAKTRASKIAETVKSVTELGAIAVELAKLSAAHAFLESRPRKGFDELARIFEDAAIARLGGAPAKAPAAKKGIGAALRELVK